MKVIQDERLHQVQSTIPIPDDEDEELQVVLKFQGVKLSFKEGQESTMSMVVEVGEEKGEVEYRLTCRIRRRL
jgi:ribosomal protein S5